jgi:hypothetical protein
MWSRHDVSLMHLRRYEKAHLRRLCRNAGFKIIFCSYFNTILFAPAALVRIFASGRGVGGSDLSLKPGLKNRIFESIFAFERFLLRHLEMPLGLSLLAVLERPE